MQWSLNKIVLRNGDNKNQSWNTDLNALKN